MSGANADENQRQHPLQRRLLAEDLLRRRLADDGQRFAACHRRGKIDPNPHQIDAVVFALRRIPMGGCILADEVGLGKTIEAGLVISQLLAEGKRRVLLIVPKSLLGQWKAELFDLFAIEARETTAHPDAFRGDGVFLIHRELAGGEKGAPLLWASDPFDLVVIDEAHEIFASIYKRYAKDGSYDEEGREAQIAHRVGELIKKHRAPALLLTATPIQNNLAELWGLVQYVEPTPALLGRIPTFREIFCEDNDRHISKANAEELRRRLAKVVQRTLRRQAQEFLEVKFVSRQTRLVEHGMAPAEKSLYDDVSAWLLRQDLVAFAGNNGKLLLIGFLRRMASSLPALVASLRKVAERVRRTLERHPTGSLPVSPDRDFSEDLEGDIDDVPAVLEPPQKDDWRQRLARELGEVEAFISRAEGIGTESKAHALLEELKMIQTRGTSGEGSGKVVIFTESLTTQDALRSLLIQRGIPDNHITLFRGNNDSPRAMEALKQWEEDSRLPADRKPSRDVAVRLALVHEFEKKSSVFISTEAGAKGLNLQFCETLVNYDLPWNPQRIEQRIGRVHRYKQKRTVTIINFLARDNEAQRLTFEILSQKLELFGTVLDASDAVLHSADGLAEPLVSAVGYDLEAELRRINLESRSPEEKTAQLRILRDQLSEKRREFDDEQKRTSHVIETRLDDAVRGAFKTYKDRLGVALGRLDKDLDRLIGSYLDALGAPYTRSAREHEVMFDIGACDRLPAPFQGGRRVRTGSARDDTDIETLHLAHPIVRAALQEAQASTKEVRGLRWTRPAGGWPKELEPYAGGRGRLALVKVAYEGLEAVDHIVTVAVMDGQREPLSKGAVDHLLLAMARTMDNQAHGADQVSMNDAIESAVFADQVAVGEREEAEFAHRLSQLDRYLDDQVLVLERRRAALLERQDKLERQYAKDITAVGREDKAQQMTTVRKELAALQTRIAALEAREDDDYRTWLDQLYARRYVAPRVETLLEIPYVLDGEGA